MSFKQKILRGLYVGGLTFALLLGVANWRSVGAQPHMYAGDKLVEQVEPQHRSDAVMITRITVGATDVQCGLVVGPGQVQPVAPFQAGNDWLQNMTIFLFNRTDKAIVAAHLTLGFPDTGDGRTRGQRVYPMQLGRRPEVDSINARTGQPIRQGLNLKPLAWEPGQTLVVHVGDYIDEIKGQVENDMPLSAVTKLRIHIGPFFFSDGMRWYLGYFAVPDPEHPGKFKNLPDAYFPGSQYQNYPPSLRP